MTLLAGTSSVPPTQEDRGESSPHKHVEVEEKIVPSTDGPINNQLPALPNSQPLREESKGRTAKTTAAVYKRETYP